MPGESPARTSSQPWDGLDSAFVRSAAAERLRVLGHHERLHIVEALSGGAKNVSAIAAETELSHATVSRHLRVMYEAQVVDCSRRGNFVLYVLADREVARLAAVAYRGASEHARRLRSIVPPG